MRTMPKTVENLLQKTLSGMFLTKPGVLNPRVASVEEFQAYNMPGNDIDSASAKVWKPTPSKQRGECQNGGGKNEAINKRIYMFLPYPSTYVTLFTVSQYCHLPLRKCGNQGSMMSPSKQRGECRNGGGKNGTIK